MCVNNLPRVAFDSTVAWIGTRDLLIASPAPYHYATNQYFGMNGEGKIKSQLANPVGYLEKWLLK